MKTKQEIINELKLEFPTLRVGNDDGYTNLTAQEYETTIAQWADARLARAEKEAKVKADAIAKAALLTQLGITEEQAKLLLS